MQDLVLAIRRKYLHTRTYTHLYKHTRICTYFTFINNSRPDRQILIRRVDITRKQVGSDSATLFIIREAGCAIIHICMHLRTKRRPVKRSIAVELSYPYQCHILATCEGTPAVGRPWLGDPATASGRQTKSDASGSSGTTCDMFHVSFIRQPYVRADTRLIGLCAASLATAR